ncbi:MAG: hypothetical protein R6W82_02230, partial [bacterium]
RRPPARSFRAAAEDVPERMGEMLPEVLAYVSSPGGGISDPQQEPDPSRWETRVYIPVGGGPGSSGITLPEGAIQG